MRAGGWGHPSPGEVVRDSVTDAAPIGFERGGCRTVVA